MTPTPIGLFASSSSERSLLHCEGCGATAEELAGQSLRLLDEERAMEASGLRARPLKGLVCEECQRQLMHQP